MPSKLTLQIDATETPPGWRAQWSRDDQPIGEPIAVQDQAARAMADLSRRFLELFEQGGRPLVDPDALRAIGRGLFATWFEPAWSAVTADGDGPGPHDLIIQSADRRVLNLPWELVELAPDLPVGCDAAWSLRRSPVKGGPRPTARCGRARSASCSWRPPRSTRPSSTTSARKTPCCAPPPGCRAWPSSSPSWAASRSWSTWWPNAARTSCTCRGTAGWPPTVRARFAFEDERGRTDSRAAAEIVARVFRGSSVRCVFFNGCQTSQADAAGLCQSLVGAGVPLAVGWSASVADDRATDFTEEFYRRLVRGEPVPAAAAHAREVIRGKGRIGQVQDATFALLQVYSSAAAGAVFDPKAAPEPYAGPRTEYVLLGDGIKGCARGSSAVGASDSGWCPPCATATRPSP